MSTLGTVLFVIIAWVTGYICGRLDGGGGRQ